MKFVIVVLMLFLPPTFALAGTFVETFDDRDLDNWREMFQNDIPSGSWEIVDSELHAMSLESFIRLLTTGDEMWHDYTIEFDVKPLEKHGIGSLVIAARIKGPQLVFCEVGDLPFGIKSNVICRTTGNFHGKYSELLYFSPHPLLKMGDWSTLKLKVHGEAFTFWINSRQIVQTGDDFTLEIHENQKTAIVGKAGKLSGFLTGSIGLGLANYTARFDDVIITGDDIPDKRALSVTPRVKLATTWGRLKHFKKK
ncbi:DUF1080 domain-containing protein [Candidatus Poribacteria bacterium]|nr:DUF1080 domain-containing protein [Candidatus Poribacteria bacterium]MXY28909.1 DUF1080 domain-containing protein [Candidatus Poribacteria bacterium]MYK18653.1 DUF1080 domain-containing protein [Candidatus Poribacteria bacterium]